MRGIHTIERENTDGDRRIVRTIDTESLTQDVDRRAFVRAAAEAALQQPTVYRVRVFLDTGDMYRRLYTITV